MCRRTLSSQKLAHPVFHNLMAYSGLSVIVLQQNLQMDMLCPHILLQRMKSIFIKVTYDSIISEQGDKPIKAYGLLALPKDRSSSSMPIISYQHGTAFGKHEVPSYAFSDQINPLSYETRLMVAQFASQGYILIAADYFGIGNSNEPEAYTVKASEQQACLDLYKAVIAFLDNEQIAYSDLFLTGWSQGGLVTTCSATITLSGRRQLS